MAEAVSINDYALWSPWVEMNVQMGIGLADPNRPIFTLDDPVYGRLDYAHLAGPDEPYVDVTCDVRRLAWGQGATRTDGVLTRWEAGTATVTLSNEDAKYDISDPESPYVPMVPVRIRARLKKPTLGPWIPVWFGFTDSWDLVWDEGLDAVVQVTATDGTKLLSSYNGPEQSPIGGGETSAQRVTRLLNEASWTDGRKITAGGFALSATTMAQDIWTELLLTVDTELGALYIDQEGAVVFVPRNLWLSRITDEVASHTWGPADLRYEDATVITDDDNLRNIVDAARAGGSQVTYRDDESVSRFRSHRWGRSDLMFNQDIDLNSWANLVLQTSSMPAVRVDGLTVMPRTDPDDLFPVVLHANYGDKWLVHVRPPGTAHDISRNVQIRGWTHEVDPDDWTTTYALSDTEWGVPFFLDGGPDDRSVLDVMRLL